MVFDTPPVLDERGRIRNSKLVHEGHFHSYNNLDDLTFAIIHGRDNIVKLLLEIGADINSEDSASGHSPLIFAITNGHLSVVKVLLNYGVNLEAKSLSGRTGLIEAAASGYTEIVQVLINAGADVNATDDFGVTPLMWAVSNGYTEIVKLLLNARADLNAVDNNGNKVMDFVPYKKIFNIPFFGELYRNERNQEIIQLLKNAKKFDE